MKVTFFRITEDLKGHIYVVGKGSQDDKFTATAKSLASYYGHKCTDPHDIGVSIDQKKGVVILIPYLRMDVDEDLAKLLIGKDIGACVKRAQQYRQNKAKI